MISYAGENNAAINNDKVKIKGLEVAYAVNYGKLNLGVDLSLLRTKDDDNKRLRRRPNTKLGLKLGYAVSDRTRLGLDASLVGSRSDIDYGSYPPSDTTLDSYSVLNVSLNQKIGKRLNLGLRVENVTDEDYELAHGYNTPKRGAYLTLSFQ